MSLRPTFLGFESMRRAIASAQKSLDITGNNIANINTEGYSKQRLDLVSINTSGGNLRYKTAVALSGQGVNGQGVTQIRDPFLDRRYRELNADSGESDVEYKILLDMEDSLDVIDADGIKVAMERFKAALQDLSVDSPDRRNFANIVMQSAKQVAQSLRTYSVELGKVEKQAEFELEAAKNRVSEIFREISVLNQQIVDGYVGAGDIKLDLPSNSYKANATYGPNEMKDKRNLLLDELSYYGNIEVTEKDDGSVDVKFGNCDKLAVQGKEYRQLGLERDANGCYQLFMQLPGAEYGGREIVPDESGLSSGALKGYLDMYNGAGCYKDYPELRTGDPSVNNFSEECGIKYYQKVIDAFAVTLADAFNAAADDPAEPLFTFGGDGTPNAANFRVSDIWEGNPEIIVKPNDGEELDNTKVQKLLSVFSQELGFSIRSGDPTPDRTCRIEDYIEYYNVKLGQQAEYQASIYDANGIMIKSISDSRDSVMSVSMDEEGINMMNFQKWFNASSRMMTTLDEALDTIINNMGLVGR